MKGKRFTLLLLLTVACRLGGLWGQQAPAMLGEAGVGVERTAPAPMPTPPSHVALRTANTVPTAVSPTDASRAAAATAAVTVQFSAAINPASVNAGTLVVKGEASGPHGGSYALSNGNTTLTFTPSTPYAPGELVNVYVTDGIEDTNGDGVLPWASKFWVDVEETDGFFGNRMSIYAGSFPFTVKPYDMNADGKADIVALINAGLNTRVLVYYNLGNGAFSAPSTASVGLQQLGCGGSSYGMDVGDLDGDGAGDLCVAVLGSGCYHVAVLLNDGAGNFPTVQRYTTPSAPDQLSMEDFNGDGALDIVASGGGIAFLGTPQVMVLLNNGNGTFAPSIQYPTDQRTFGLAHADIDNDGDADLLTGNSSAANFTVLLNDGYGVFGPPTAYAAGTLPRDILVLDLDNDGWEDVVVSNQTNVDPGTLTIYYNQGNGTFGNRQDVTTNGLPVGLGASDVDGDGDLDFACANHFGGAVYSYRSVSLFLNNGGTYVRTDLELQGFQPYDVNFADFNGDGAVDIVTGSGSGYIDILYNLTPNIIGEVYVDENEDCNYNIGTETPLPMVLIQAVDELGSEYYAYTNSAGKYAFSVPANHTYDVALAKRQGYETTCPYGVGDHFVKYVGGSTVGIPGDRIGLKSNCGATLGGFITLSNLCNSPACVHGPARTPCPCEQFTYTLQVNNTYNSAIPTGTVITVSLPPLVKLCNTTPVNTSYTIGYSGGTLNNAYSCPSSTCSTPDVYGGNVDITLAAPILGNSSATFIITLETANVSANCQPLSFGAAFTTWAGNSACIQNTTPHTYTDALCCSYDPNDKKVHPSDANCAPTPLEDPFYYTVRFQNTGTAPAYKVVVRDAIDDDLDMESFRPLATSHTLTDLNILPGNEVEWVFDGIMLADSGSDMNASMGHLGYSIYAKTDVEEGAVISNRAAIYFDANPPVITNTTVNQIAGDDDFPASFSWEQTFNCRWSLNPYSYHFFYTGTETGAQLDWTFGPDANVPVASGSDIWLDFAGSGNKTVTLTVTVGHCSWTKTMTFNANGTVPICHVAPIPGSGGGNHQTIRYNYVTLYVPLQAAMQHMQHGDFCGPCQQQKAGEQPVHEQSMSLGIAPNPASQTARLSYEVNAPAEVKIRLLDQLGREVKRVFQGYCDHVGSLDMNLDMLPEGVYYVEMTNGQERITQKLVVVK